MSLWRVAFSFSRPNVASWTKLDVLYAVFKDLHVTLNVQEVFCRGQYDAKRDEMMRGGRTTAIRTS
jgi:hypothetical protein